MIEQLLGAIFPQKLHSCPRDYLLIVMTYLLSPCSHYQVDLMLFQVNPCISCALVQFQVSPCDFKLMNDLHVQVCIVVGNSHTCTMHGFT